MGFFNTTCLECGDQCIGNDYSFSLCHCGNETFHPYVSFKHCCITPNTTCFKEDSFPYNVVCREGEVKPMYIPCENNERSLQCFNSYQDNKKIDRLFSHYTCPKICVPCESNMCQGVSWCENDEEECGPNLRCNHNMKQIYKHLIVASEHKFCKNRWEYLTGKNNSEYDKIDRSDENMSKSKRAESYININHFKPCNRNDNDTSRVTSGLICDTICWPSSKWCLADTSNMLVPMGIDLIDPRSS